MKHRTKIALACILALALIGTSVGYHRAQELGLRIDAIAARERRWQSELDRLRRGNDFLKAETERAVSSPGGDVGEDEKVAADSFRLLRQIDDLKDWIARVRPNPQLPEIQYMDEKDWVAAANILGDGRSDADYRRAWRRVRDSAMTQATSILWYGFMKYTYESGGRPPDTMDDLRPYIPALSNPVLFSHYRLVDDAAQGKMIKANGGSINLDDPSDTAGVYISRQGCIWSP